MVSKKVPKPKRKVALWKSTRWLRFVQSLLSDASIKFKNKTSNAIYVMRWPEKKNDMKLLARSFLICPTKNMSAIRLYLNPLNSSSDFVLLFSSLLHVVVACTGLFRF